MQHEMSGKVDGKVEFSRGLTNKALLVAAGLTALVAGWIACVALVAAFILRA